VSAAPPSTVVISTSGLRAADVVAVARHGVPVLLSEDAVAAMTRARAAVEALAAGATPAYGVSTGFGALATRHIPPELRSVLQERVIRSHSAGMGDPVEAEVVRAAMLLRLKSLCSGRTGIRPVVAATYASILNAKITPVVPEFGSLGCSGDLAPLAHCALTAMGEGEAFGPGGERAGAGELLAIAAIEPIHLEAKEGLSLINGTDGMLGMLVLALADLRALATTADVTAAMSVEALLGTDQAFLPELVGELRPHPGQRVSAANLVAMLAGSAIIASHREGDDRVQDAYSLRCAPQVTGALRDTITHATAVADHELAAAIDNPVVLDDGSVRSNGNFHGAPLAYVLDFLAIAAADSASISERRTDRLLDPARSSGLPPFLAEDPGVDSGLMIAHYTQASLVATMRRLATPASVDSIPTSAMQEDHVSMGWSAGRKLREGVRCLTRVLAVEAVTAARALALRADLEPAPATHAAAEAVRRVAGGVGHDRFLAPELAAAERLVASGGLVAAARSIVGDLQ
jgi:histidine ammonia-lyase